MGFFDQRDYGNESLNFVAGLMRQYWGREPSEAEVRGFGDPGKKGYDTNFRNKITDAIRSSGDTAAYAKRQEEEAAAAKAQQDAPAQEQPQNTGGGGAQPWSRDWVKAYARQRGFEFNDQEADYWVNKYPELEARGREIGNPNYAMERLQYADQFGGGAYPGGGGDGTVFGRDIDPYIKPFDEQFDHPDFVAPTGVSEENDPGFNSAMKSIKDTLEHSAASHGNLLSGNTSAALTDRATQFTLGEFDKLFNRDLTKYNTNRQGAFDEYQQRRANFYQNQDSPFAKLFGLQQASDARNQFNSDLASRNQNALNDLNFRYANLGGNLLSGGSSQYNDYLTGGANAGAAGTIGSGNAYASLFGSLAQMPWLAAYLQGRK